MDLKSNQSNASEGVLSSNAVQGQAVAAVPTNQHYVVMPSFFYLSLLAMQKGANSWLEQQSATLDGLQKMLLTMVWGQENQDGTWTMDFSKGFIQNIVTADIAQGEDDKKVSLTESTSHLSSAITNGASTATGLAGAGYDTVKITGINKQINATKGLRETIVAGGRDTPMDVTLGGCPLIDRNDPGIPGRINDWEAGKFEARGSTELELNRNAAAVLKADPVRSERVSKQMDAELNSLNRERDLKSQASDGRVRYLQMGTSLITNSVDTQMAVNKGAAQEQKGKDTAAASAFQSDVQAMNSAIDSLKDSAGKAQQNAEHQISTIGQLRA